MAVAAEPWRIVILEGRDPAQPSRGGSRPPKVSPRTDAGRCSERCREVLPPAPSIRVRFQGTDLMPEYLALLTRSTANALWIWVVVRSDFQVSSSPSVDHQQLWPDKPVLPALTWRSNDAAPARRAEPSSPCCRCTSISTARWPSPKRCSPLRQRLSRRAGEPARSISVGPSARHWRRASAPPTLAAGGLERRAGVRLRDPRHGQLSTLNTAVFYPVMYRDRDGNSYFPYEVVPPMVEVLRVPIYGWYPTYIDAGATAGSVAELHRARPALGGTGHQFVARRAGARCRRTRCRYPPQLCGQRGPHRRPPDSTCARCPPAANSCQQPRSVDSAQYRRGELIAALAVLALQALTIAGLLLQRHRRQLAEDEASRRRLELAARDAGGRDWAG